jgi:fatty acid-binding protein DegV
MTIGLLTDSSAQLQPELAARHRVAVVPIPILLDGVSFEEGIDLDADEFFSALESGAQVLTSQPSPGAFGRAYRQLADDGATEILAVLLGSEYSGTYNSARLAARDAPVPVTLVDSGNLSYGTACCVLEAAQLIDSGASVDQAAGAARATAGTVATTFIVRPEGLSRRADMVDLPWAEGAVSVMLMGRGRLDEIGHGRSVEEICDLLVAPMLAEPGPIRAAVSVADDSAKPYWVGMEERLADAPSVAELLRYRVGPSVAAHTGAGTAGGYWHRLTR